MKFDRPIGATAVAALHQISHSDGDGDWMDGSIDGKAYSAKSFKLDQPF